MTLRHPGISPTNDLVAKKIFSNPEITCQFIRDMLDLPAKNVTILEGSNIHVLPSLPYSAQDFYTSIDVLAELDNETQVIIEIQVHHQNFFINRLWAYLCSQVNQNLEKIRQREGDTHQSYKHIANKLTSDFWVAKDFLSYQVIGWANARMSENHPFPPFIIPQF